MGSVPDVTSDVPSLPASVLHRSEFNDDSEIPAPPAKRARVMAPQNAFFGHAEMDGVSAEKIEDLVGSFMGTCPGLVRATLASLPTDLPVLNSFLVLQITSSRGACTFMQQKRWRLLCREILPCGTRGACSYLTITDFLPVVTTAMPAEFSVRTEWADFKSAPVIVLSGFTQETDKFMNPNWNANLMCGPDSIPRILLGTVSKSTVPLFVSDFNVAQANSKSAIGGDAASLLPFAAMNKALQAVQKGPATLKIDTALYNRNVANLGYTSIAQLVAGYKKLNVFAVVKHFFSPKLVNQGRSLMQVIHIVDPSLDIRQDEKLLCFFYATSPERLPPVSKTGDIILIRNLHVVMHDDKRQGKAYQDSCKFAVVNDGRTDERPGSTTGIPATDAALINLLRKWYQEFAETVVSDLEAKWKQENDQRAAEKERQVEQAAAPPVQMTAPSIRVPAVIPSGSSADQKAAIQTVIRLQGPSTKENGELDQPPRASEFSGQKIHTVQENHVDQISSAAPISNLPLASNPQESSASHNPRADLRPTGPFQSSSDLVKFPPKDGRQQLHRTLTDRLFCRTV